MDMEGIPVSASVTIVTWLNDKCGTFQDFSLQSKNTSNLSHKTRQCCP